MRKRQGWILLLILSLSLFGLTACQKNHNEPTPSDHNEMPAYEQISAKEAKALMDSGTEYVVIDARTAEEFAQGHIEGAVMIPEYEIAARAETELPDKDALILVYCRSGRRSKMASEELVKLGYTNVKEFGGILDWPYEVVK